MTVYLVTCITKDDRESWHDRITEIGIVRKYRGGSILDLEAGRIIPAREAVRMIRNGDVFTTNGALLDEPVVEVVPVQGGEPYLRTKRNMLRRDNLLNMPDCRPKSTNPFSDPAARESWNEFTRLFRR